MKPPPQGLLWQAAREWVAVMEEGVRGKGVSQSLGVPSESGCEQKPVVQAPRVEGTQISF